jgi:hypothetical protein
MEPVRSPVRSYLAAFQQDWVTLMSGIASVISGIVAALRGQLLPNWIFWPICLACFLFASYRVWLHEHQRANEAEAKLAEPGHRLEAIRQKLNSFEQWKVVALKKLLASKKMYESLASAELLAEGFGNIEHPFDTINRETGWLRRGDGDEYTIQILYEEDLRKILRV